MVALLSRDWLLRVADPVPDQHHLLPICGVCHRHSAIFSVVEQYDRNSRGLLLCRSCFIHRSLLWERFAIHVQVTRLDYQNQSS